MTDSITLLRAGSNKSLAKIWATDGDIIPAANATWFEGKEIPVASVQDICHVLDRIERWRRVALVKEAFAPGVDVNRLRRRCSAGVDEYTGEPFPAGLVVVPRAGSFSTLRSFRVHRRSILMMAQALQIMRGIGCPMRSSARLASGN
jgi:hypothetical protein